MGNSMSAIIAVVAMSTLLLMPATSSAEAGGVAVGNDRLQLGPIRRA